jgi:phage regulator Rha-like protein
METRMKSTDIAAVPLTMSTLEIAGLTGKRHDHVLRDADKMLAELELGAPKFGASYLTEQNKTVRLLNLPKRECLILVSGYSAEVRALISMYDKLIECK